MEKRVILKNISCSLLLQIVTIISGFVIPKVILNYFGSDVNGLISSMNQFLNYIQLLEGGLSGVIMAALYKPLAENDTEKISAVINATRKFFRSIGIIFIVYMMIVAFVYPLFVKTGFSYAYSLSLVLVLGSNLFVQYFFSLTYKLLLNSDRKVYIVSVTQIVIVVFNMLAVVILARLFADVLIVKLASAIIYLIQPFVYGIYVNKRYSIDKTIPADNEALSQRWSGFGINLAYFVHTNTDVIILTFFSTLANVSVYAVYLMVINAMKNFVIAVSQAIVPSFGKVLVSEDNETTNEKFEIYEFGIYLITTIVFTCGMFLITPFIHVYTSNIHDANYNQYLFGYLLTIAEMIYCYRDPYVAVAYTAGHFKQVTKYAIIEVIINLTLSLALVHRLGIAGVAIGTLVSMIYRGIAHVIYIKNNILFRHPIFMVKKFIVFGGLSTTVVILSNILLNDSVSTYLGWFSLGIVEFGICLSVVGLGAFVFYRKLLKKLLGNKISKLTRLQA